MKMLKKIFMQIICIFLILSFTVSTVFANTTHFEIIFEDGIYYIEDPEFPMEYLVIYCMNNRLNWPHQIGGVEPPEYVYGYLEPGDIENYDEMIEKLERILYAGYPHNQKNLYMIIDDEELYVPSEKEFNDLLKPFPELVKAFPELGYNEITISNFEEHKDILRNFLQYVTFTMKDTDIKEGLTKSAIMSMPFFKALLCLLNYSSPREAFANFFSTSYYVTEKQAFENTQHAIWKLMNDYKVPDNNINSLSSYPLGEALMNYATLSEVILDSEPEEEVILTGDFNFTQKEDGKWYSGKIQIEEPEGYNAIYSLDLPEGISVLNGDHWNIYGNTEFTLVSDSLPNLDDRFIVFCPLMWGMELRQYSPAEEVIYNGKKFQNMTGLHLNTTHIYTEFTYGDVATGDLIVNKTVNGNASDTLKEFTFTVTLSDQTINGTYGDMEFKDGIANFTLKHKESKTATDLPVGITYTVSESDNEGYTVESENANGTINGNKISSVTFTNTNNSSNLTAGSLMVEKKVSGIASDTNKPFTFTVTLSDQTINGTYGDMEFKDGVANFTLKHKESKTATGLPVGITYTVTESDNDGYTVESQNEHGTINSTQTSVATFMNIKNSNDVHPYTGILSVEKIVVGDGADTSKDFTFTVTLSDKTINGTYNQITFVDGVSEFTLKHGQSKTALGLPEGITYTVTESDNDGYTVKSENESGSIIADKWITAFFLNKKTPIQDPTGNLSVEKIVSGNAADTNKNFTFTATLSDNTINGTYGDMEFKDGVATFTLKHKEIKTATGLPEGITYTVTESDNDGYTVKSENESGSIIADQTVSVSFTNTKNKDIIQLPTGKLSVEKIVSGNAGDTNKAFTFTVTLSDNTINGTYGDMEFKDGVATFTLKHKETKTAKGLPEGITYEVTESDNDGYTVESQNESGSIIADQTVSASFTNIKNSVQLATGNLSVEKIVSGNAADTNKDFTFTVTLSDNTINGAYGDMEFKDGIATFTLKHKESKTAIGLPVGITYTVTESDNAGYTVKSENASGSIIADQTVSVSFTNTKNKNIIQLPTGNLSVEKIVSGNAADTNKNFTFTVTLSDNTINGTYGDMEFKDGIATFTLKHKETKTATGLPVGITYTVTESDNEGYTVESQNESGSIIADQTVSASFTNTKNIIQLPTGNLSIEKIVSGNAADTSKAFTFTVTLSDNTINGTYGDMEFKNGIATFTLKHKESKTATGLPLGITYTVTESNNEGYTVKSENVSGIITEEDISVKFNNILSSPFDSPESGDTSNILLWTSALLLSSMAIIVPIILKYKKKK